MWLAPSKVHTGLRTGDSHSKGAKQSWRALLSSRTLWSCKVSRVLNAPSSGHTSVMRLQPEHRIQAGEVMLSPEVVFWLSRRGHSALRTFSINIPDQHILTSQFSEELGYQPTGGTVVQTLWWHRRNLHNQLREKNRKGRKVKRAPNLFVRWHFKLNAGLGSILYTGTNYIYT